MNFCSPVLSSTWYLTCLLCSWIIELNTWRQFPYLHTPMCYRRWRIWQYECLHCHSSFQLLIMDNFLCSVQRTCFNALHLQAVQRRLKNMRLRMAEDLWQRFVSGVNCMVTQSKILKMTLVDIHDNNVVVKELVERTVSILYILFFMPMLFVNKLMLFRTLTCIIHCRHRHVIHAAPSVFISRCPWCCLTMYSDYMTCNLFC